MAPIMLARAAALSLCAIATFTVAYTCITDGSPFRKELLTPWMAATLVDFYALVAILSAWISYKEDTLLSRVCWIVLLICFGSITASLYVAIQLFKLEKDAALFLVLLKDRHARKGG